MDGIVPCLRLDVRLRVGRARGWPREEIDHVQPVAINQRRRWMAVYVVESATDQWEFLRREVEYDRREVKLAVEPGLHRMLIRRQHVSQMIRHQGAHVACDHLAAQSVTN